MSLIETSPLRARLREATQAPHERMHAHDGFGGAASGRLALPAYRDLLARLYGFHKAFDAAFTTAPAEFAAAIRLPARARSSDLAQDLVALGVGACLEGLPICGGAPRPRSEAEWLGALYVTEGSTLGGAQIAKALDGLVEGVDGRRFFLAYGERRSEMWRVFLARLEAFGVNPAAADAVEDAAVQTFEAFETWMRDWRGAFQFARTADCSR
jgi:heme oxygenase